MNLIVNIKMNNDETDNIRTSIFPMIFSNLDCIDHIVDVMSLATYIQKELASYTLKVG